MSLEVKSWKKYRSKIIWGVVLLILGGVILRLAIWEHNYYQDKEGSERAVAVNNTEPEVDETEVTDSDRDQHIVAADEPRFLSIARLNIVDARVIQVGLSENGQMLTPNNIFDVGWYTGSAKPGTGGTTIIDGHNGGPNIYGVFKRTPELQVGDVIKIEMGDGTIYNYQIADNTSVPLSTADDWMLQAAQSPEPGRESITLITCTGEWSQVQQTYLSRQFTRAVKVE